MKNIHLYFGEEKLLIDSEISAIKGKIVPDHMEMVNYIRIDGQEASEQEIINAMSTVPMMSEHKLVLVKELRWFSGSKGAGVSEAFLEFLERPPEHTLTIFTTQKLDKRRRIYKLFKKRGIIKDFSKPSPRQRAQWLQRRAKDQGKDLDLSAAYYLLEYTVDLTQADNELKKVIAYNWERPRIRRQDMDLVFSKSLEANIFRLTDFIGEKKSGPAMMVLQEMMIKGEKAIVILFMISKHLLDLALVKSMAGKSFGQIREALGLHPFVAKKALEQSRNFTLPELNNALKLCQQVDLNIKRGRINERLGIELLIAKISA